MNPSLRNETEKLTRSWMRHEAEMLRDYLVADVEDPRINLQSIFTRHFLVWELIGNRLEPIMGEEYRFSAVMNSLFTLARRLGDLEERDAVLYALQHGSDNAEGFDIPQHIVQAYAALPATVNSFEIPNYVQQFLAQWSPGQTRADQERAAVNTFQEIWRELLGSAGDERDLPRRPSVLEPACGSANDYRFLERYGLAQLIDYSGFDLCPKNVENARGLFANVRFDLGNVFEVGAADHSYDYCFVHDLLEHLSPEGIEAGIRELCRVTRRAICIHFFSMDETREHLVQPVDDYFWNLLSMGQIRGTFASYGFEAQVFHLATFLRQRTGAGDYHNPTAYTFLLRRRGGYS